MWYPIKTPKIVKMLFPKLLCSFPETEQPAIYLSFDDGPIPEITPWVLEQLAQYNAKATFFCIGNNVAKNPDIYHQILEAGHSVGNHTFNHLNGWKTDTKTYVENTAACAELVKSRLFRPPYGRLRRKQRQLLQSDYQIVLWDVIAGDFDLKLTPEKCLNNILCFSKNGSIIVLHDSKKAWPRLEYVLPRLLKYYAEKGFEFKGIGTSKE